MIVYKHTNLLTSNAEALVNTVNLMGIMGKGIALQFKEHFPLNFKLYQKACNAGQLQIGRVFLTETGQLTGPKYIINFATKTDWRSHTKVEYIRAGLEDLVRVIREKKIKSIAVPPLGCGNGGLDWNIVKPIIEAKLFPISDQVNIEIYEPGHHSYTKTTNYNKTPELTKSRALILALAERYHILGFDISHLEIQKLAYFLQEFGQEDLRLRFEQGHYGPYATNLKHLIAHLEGTYVKGQIRFQDMKPTDALSLVEDQLSSVHAFLDANLQEEERNRLRMVSDLIEGFESPYGLELLATVHWAKKQLQDHTTAASVKTFIDNWSTRKKNLMALDQVNIALQRVEKYFA